ncbi:AraC family transcriptional regulator [Paenibacillus cellulositrophicus]|uniref:AraC family transcriptional regulator n=1 Tax=Paenibacillus cellulositrophicus TaxID=562959 RepID=UPI00203BDB29|nr:AraC family transcriptional regulator [Paenibacillus cellulositrophicus]MCM2997717.1 AraC family transcriptional regulator [Paenibacillus cellulositrophicus]
MGEVNYENAEGTFSVSYRKALSHHMPSSHFHSTYEVYYLMSGSREFFIKDRTMVVSEGDVVIVPPNILHRTTNAAMPRHERLVVNIHECFMALNGAYKDILQPLFDQEYVIVKNSPYSRSSVETISRGIIQEVQDKRPGFDMYAQALVLQLLILCCRHAGQALPERPEAPSPMHERISEVVHYINQHYMQDLSLHGLAERFYTSPYYLSRFFKVATGFTFVEYVNSVRIKEAKHLLEQTTLKVNLIARKVGFGSVTHFGRVFKSVTGHAPLYYRKGK